MSKHNIFQLQGVKAMSTIFEAKNLLNDLSGYTLLPATKTFT